MNIPTLIAAVIVFLVIGFAFFTGFGAEKRERAPAPVPGAACAAPAIPGSDLCPALPEAQDSVRCLHNRLRSDAASAPGRLPQKGGGLFAEIWYNSP